MPRGAGAGGARAGPAPGLFTSSYLVDYLRWYFGDPLEVLGVVERVSGLELDVEDTAAVLLGCAQGPVIALWLDYLQRRKEHRIQITVETRDLC